MVGRPLVAEVLILRQMEVVAESTTLAMATPVVRVVPLTPGSTSLSAWVLSIMSRVTL